ncbi:hypothetical protein CC1G_03193 [Coprinopsis cinerea okayama7|uniref:Uncharacterized protein n=1 Tax=Coprinopsis cinerea (strain Okayama-7 / 130 / ATCC MYA-4618 / FGSC 9003) TaxID=240176 RepID=A8N750_COPC7|nr:hypothetical protein CC1G_03193 [Coprinopsis cinerea okayama7\|eukprot:XP_001830656.2 hypothetical protein CC1G_03193 [Coprinopsis cinerea okayama7\
MNVTQYISEVTSQVTQTSPSAYPGLVWTYYIRYLWNYEPESWVARIAYFFRVFAILLSLPTLLLGLLVRPMALIRKFLVIYETSFLQDIVSYGIARTLGVIDDVKASTSDKATVHIVENAPSIRVEDTDSLAGGDSLNQTPPSKPSEFFATDNNVNLSGVDVLSPAASRPPSPTITRKSLQPDRQPPVIADSLEEPRNLRQRHLRNQVGNSS